MIVIVWVLKKKVVMAMSIFSNIVQKANIKRCESYCEDAKNFIQVHFVRERDSDRYAFQNFTLKNDPDKERCEGWYAAHGNPASFSEIVDIYLSESELKAATICNEYGLESRVFSSDSPRSVEKWEAIAICFGLDLNIVEARALLKSAGYALTNSSKSDLVIRYCLENDIYMLPDINYILEKICERKLNQIS